ncbi:hypothetical protein, partial [Novosphingobium sp. YAF33]|uniref:hypothetical protein n=1 Tax=Novosphingobium sp. YAF33 TaxID=3233082 RepID=UPI003F9565FE
RPGKWPSGYALTPLPRAAATLAWFYSAPWPTFAPPLTAIGQETRLDILKLLSDAPEAGLASGSIATELDERREPADIADVVALRLVAEAPYIDLVEETLLA